MADNEQTMEQEDRGRDRSPPFPFIPLSKAVARASEFEQHYRRSPGRVANVLPIWNYTPKSSGGLQTIGALRQFGLLEDEGSGPDRKVKLTELAFRILKDERPGKREEAIREAALKPRAIAERLNTWGSPRPPDRECLSELELDLGFTPDAAPRFLRVYDDTVEYARLKEADKLPDESQTRAQEQIKNLDKPALPRVKVGDSIQWEPAGVLQFAEAKRVTGVSEAGDFVFVEGSSTGLPMSEVRVMTQEADQPAESRVTTEALMTVLSRPVRQDVFNLDEGPVVLNYPAKMSAESFEDFEGWIQLQLKKIKRGITQ